MNEIIVNNIALTKEIQDFISPELAFKMLKEGNERFVKGSTLSRDLKEQVAKTSKGQFPFAAILSCIDSRVPAEIIFDQGIGDIFNVRIAGNFVNDDILGSLEFACKVAGSKAILVLGHSSCGAVKGACDKVQLGNLTGMLEKLMPAVDSVDEEKEKRNSSNPEFVQRVAEMNVRLTISDILQHSEVLKEMSEAGEIKIAGAMYDVETAKVDFFDQSAA